MSCFVFAVDPSGVCTLRSKKTFRRLAGGAYTECQKAILRHVKRNIIVRKATAETSGSRLFLKDRRFHAVLSAKACPVTYLLGVYKWPVRSAVLLTLCRIFLSKPYALRLIPRRIREDFVKVAAKSLGQGKSAISIFQRERIKFDDVPMLSGVASVEGVTSAFKSLTRCLNWLNHRNGCPGALRGSLGLLGALVLLSLKLK